MVQKVNGGIKRDQVETGTLRAFIIDCADIDDNAATADAQTWTLANGYLADGVTPATGVAALYDTGRSVPNTIADIVVRLIETRATVVSIDFAADQMHVLLANASAWGDGANDGSAADQSLTAALVALGTTVAYSKVGGTVGTKSFAAATATQVKLTFVNTAATYEQGLGGN